MNRSSVLIVINSISLAAIILALTYGHISIVKASLSTAQGTAIQRAQLAMSANGSAGNRARGQRVKREASKLKPHRISLAGGRSFDLNLPEGYAVKVVAQGLKRVRF